MYAIRSYYGISTTLETRQKRPADRRAFFYASNHIEDQGLLAISMATARAAAADAKKPLYKYLASSDDALMPVPMMNIINRNNFV